LSKGARPALKNLLANLDARYVVLSYNADGIIPAEEMLDILSDFGQAAIRGQSYTSFRGGRQSQSRRASTAEYAFILVRSASYGRGSPIPSGKNPASDQEFRDLLVRNRIFALLKGTHHPDRLSEFRHENGITLPPRWENLRFDRWPDFHKNEGAGDWLSGLASHELLMVESCLNRSVCQSRIEELAVWLDFLTHHHHRLTRAEIRFCQRKALFCLSKIAYFKYSQEFGQFAVSIDSVAKIDREKFALLISGLEGLRVRMRARTEHHLTRKTKKDRDEAIGLSR
jgi:hypothetical protein